MVEGSPPPGAIHGGSANVVEGSPPSGAIRGKSSILTGARRLRARVVLAQALQVDHVVGYGTLNHDGAAKLLFFSNSLS